MISDDDVKKLKTIFATKDELMKFATKDDLRKSKQELLDKIDEKYFKIFDLVDGLAGEIRDSRGSRTIFSYRIEELEKRMEMVEKKLA